MPYKDPAKQKIAQRESHERLRDERRRADRVRKQAGKELIREYKDKPCADCGNSYPFYVMQFDHVSGEKVAGISRFVSNRQWKKAIEEIEKCEVVCANCHAERTYIRQAKGVDHLRFIL